MVTVERRYVPEIKRKRNDQDDHRNDPGKPWKQSQTLPTPKSEPEMNPVQTVSRYPLLQMHINRCQIDTFRNTIPCAVLWSLVLSRFNSIPCWRRRPIPTLALLSPSQWWLEFPSGPGDLVPSQSPSFWCWRCRHLHFLPGCPSWSCGALTHYFDQSYYFHNYLLHRSCWRRCFGRSWCWRVL